MGRSTICFSLVVLIALTEILPSQADSFNASSFHFKQPITLTYYLHDSFVPGTETAVLVASALANGTSAGFGDLRVFNSPLRQTTARNSTKIGTAGGTLADISHLEPTTFVIFFTHNVNSTEYVGTISGQGRVTPLTSAWQVAVIGGTGSFAGARGYADVFAFLVTDISDIVLRYTFHIFF